MPREKKHRPWACASLTQYCGDFIVLQRLPQALSEHENILSVRVVRTQGVKVQAIDLGSSNLGGKTRQAILGVFGPGF